MSGGPRVQYPGVYVEELSHDRPPIVPVETATTAFLGWARRGPVDEGVILTGFEDFERVFGGLWERSSMSFAVRDFFLNGGAKAVVVRLEPGDGKRERQEGGVLGSPEDRRGLYALEGVDRFDLLCLPPFEESDVELRVLQEAAGYCAKRRAILLIDPPARCSLEDARVFRAKLDLRGENAAFYFPRLRQPNALNGGRIEDFVPCGAVAGVIARTDATRGVWKAPAGLEADLRGASGLSVELSDAENGVLNPLGVNCLRSMPGAGFVVWGARTVAGDDRLASPWKYLPVRRTALFIEESVDRGTRWAAFEPNGEELWGKLRLEIGSFLHGLFRQGAFQGMAPKEAYFVKCDTQTTTQADIDHGRVNIVMGFAPLRPAEFVILDLQHTGLRPPA